MPEVEMTAASCTVSNSLNVMSEVEESEASCTRDRVRAAYKAFKSNEITHTAFAAQVGEALGEDKLPVRRNAMDQIDHREVP
jgi:hypothetical protein